MSSSAKNSLLAAGTLIVGGLLFFGKQIVGAAETFVFENFLFDYKKVRVKWTGTIKILGITIPTGVSVVTELRITNKNPVGGTVNSFKGNLRFGQGGTIILPLNSLAFDIASGETVDLDLESPVNVLTASSTLKQIWSKIIRGEIKKLWMDGTLVTSYGTYEPAAEIPIKL